MKKSEEPVAVGECLELEFPDWNGMDDSSSRITPEAAFRLCELYPMLFGKSRLEARNNGERRIVEFVL